MEDLIDIRKAVGDGAKSLKALDVRDVMLKCQDTLLTKKGLNILADKSTFAPLSKKTVARYIEDMTCKEVTGKDQAENREEAFNDIRNAMAKAAGLFAMAKIVLFIHTHSADEVGLFLFGWHQTASRPKLVVTAEANAWLRKNNVSVSKSTDPNQQRCVHIGTTMAVGGSLTAIYFRLVDSNIPDLERKGKPGEFKPWIFCLNKVKHVYGVVCNARVTETVISEYIGKYIDSKAIAEKQEIAIEEELETTRAGMFAGLVFAEGSEPPTPEDLDPGMIYN